MERMVLRDIDWTRIACDAGELGINTIDTLKGEAVLHEDGSIPTYESTTSADDARIAGEAAVRKLARDGAEVPHITFEVIHIIPHSLGLVFYPVWIARYEYSGRSYFCTLDGVTGSVLSGRAPGDPLYRSLALTFGSMVGGLVAGAATAYGGGDGIVFGILFGGGIFAACYYFFRHGGEIIQGNLRRGGDEK
jgi:hypothetical protein